VQDSVTVEAVGTQLQSATAELGSVLTRQQVVDLPMGRSIQNLMRITPGVNAISTGQSSIPSVNGQINRSSMYMLDGLNNQATFYSNLALNPIMETIEEFKVQSHNDSVEVGGVMGGVINTVTKSGTNKLHGSLYEYNQVSALAANQFFYNANGVPRPAYRYNQYGLSAGGPLWIPKIFNGKNRVFWMFAWQGLKDSDPANSPRETGNPVNFATVPTAAERQGDFSALLKANTPGNDYTIYDPATGVVSGSRVMRTPFPNNVIPTSRLNPVSLKYLQYYPQPNLPGQINGFRNYVVNAIDSDSYDNELARLDVNLSQEQAFGRLPSQLSHPEQKQLFQ